MSEITTGTCLPLDRVGREDWLTLGFVGPQSWEAPAPAVGGEQRGLVLETMVPFRRGEVAFVKGER